MSEVKSDKKELDSSAYEAYSIDELEATEVATLLLCQKEKRELAEDEYARHYEYVRRVRKSHESTHKQFTTKIKGKAVYSEERLALHEKIVAGLLNGFDKNEVTCAGEVLFIGGISGAGKTSILSSGKIDFDAQAYVTINPDQIKLEMVKLGMTPAIPGLLPLEVDELIKYEAGLIADKVYEKFSSLKANLVIDKTMASKAQVAKTIEDLKSKGYLSFRGVFVDVDPDEAHERIRLRHLAGVNKTLVTGEGYGARAVPGFAVAATRTDHPIYRSKNAEIFVELADAGAFNAGVEIFDSSKADRKLTLEQLRTGEG